ncbi:MAG: methyltransferase [Oscillospiraceae bacterium]|nr:methyltransferase [Oscillospiraceae bacterium]
MEESLYNGIRMLQPEGGFRLGTDSMLLAHFLELPRAARVADLGAGCGTLGLLLCARAALVQVTGVELRSDAWRLAQENIARNSLEERLRVLQGDVREIKTLLPASSFDCVISNPPYFAVGSGAAGNREIERTEAGLNLQQLCAAAAWLLPHGGRFALVHRPERLCDIFCEMRRSGVEPKRIRFVRHTAQSAVCLVLIEGRKGGAAGLKYEPDFVEFHPDGSPTDEYRAVYKGENTT